MDVRQGEKVSCNLNVPYRNIAFVLSCPGRLEQEYNILCKGETGENLNIIIGILNKEHSDVFQSTDRYEYLLTNASEKVHYKGHSLDSEPSKDEISDKSNIQRLENELQYADYIIAMGAKARMAIGLCRLNGVVVANVSHPSPKNMRLFRKIKHDDIAKEIIDQLRLNDCN